MYKFLLFIGFFSFSNAYTLPYRVAVQEEQTLWIALFGLALIGVFALFLSSDQIKHINQKHDNMIKIQADIEQKQQMILEFMSEKIEVSTKGILRHKEVLMQNSFEKMTPKFFQEEMERFEESEASLLDATHELVDFLQVKSGNLEIRDESYKLSSMLNETYGSISDRLKKSKTELVYDIDLNVATELKGDSKRMEQVLRTLLTDMFNDVKNSVVSLKVSFAEKDKNKLSFELHNKNKKLTQEEIESLFSTYSLKEEDKTKEKLDLYVAYELVKHMGGDLNVQSSREEGTYYTVELPYEPQKASLLLSTKSKGKKVLLMEKEQEVGHLVANMIRQHEVDVEVYSAQRLKSQIPDFHHYDIVLINTTLFSHTVLDKLKKVRSEKGCQVIELQNIYDRSNLLDVDKKLIDATLQKPLQNEQIFNLFEKLFDMQKNNRSKNVRFTSLKETAGVTIESFTRFSHVYVLIAEDNQMNQKILRGVLGNSGMKIIMVKNGQEALDEVRRNKELDLVFMDINMPTMDGYEATKEIREIYDEKHLPIVAISGAESQKDLDKMASVGANAYIHKPYQIGELYSAFAMYATEENS
jgi:CheY-like chemotaxis protein